MSVGVSRDCSIFRVLPISSGFCTNIYRLNRSKSPLKISGINSSVLMWTMMKANSYGDYITMITDYASKYAYLRLNYGLKVVEDST